MSTAADLGAALSAARAGLLHDSDIVQRARIDAFDLLPRLATSVLDVPAAVVSLATEVGDRIRFQAAVGLSAPFGPIPDGTQTICAQVLKDGGVLVVDDVSGHPIADTWDVQHLGIKALVALPLQVGRTAPFGVLILIDFAPRPWRPEDVVAAQRIVAALLAPIAGPQREEQAAAARADLAEAALVENAETLRAFIDQAPGPLLAVVDGRIVYANGAAVSLCGGRDAEDVRGRPVTDLIAGPYLKRVREQILGHAGPTPLDVEILRRLDGRSVYAEVAVAPYVTRGRPALLLLIHDVSSRHEAEEALRLRETELRLILDQIPVFTWTTDVDLRLTSARGGSAGQKHPVHQRVGARLALVFDEGQGRTDTIHAHQRALAGTPARFGTEWDGRVFDVRIDPLTDPHQAVIGSVACATDVTAQVRMQRHLEDAGRFESLGRVAGGVAHEINNVLAGILGTTSVHELRPGIDPVVRSAFATVSASARRGGLIVADLLGFAGKGVYRTERVGVADLLASVASQIRTSIPLGVGLRIDVASDAPDFDGGHVQLEHALTHLCVNSLEAMRQGGELTLRARLEHIQEHPFDPGLPAPGSYVRIDVSDTGEGMSEATRARATEPFFSTKPLGTGVGLGLSMAYGVARLHQGALGIESQAGVGTTVTMRFPARRRPAVVAPPALTDRIVDDPPEISTVGRGTVLIVDDDRWARDAFEQILEHLGYTTVSAQDGPEGLACFSERTGDFAFILLDMIMPVMDGAEVLRRLIAEDPNVRVILCTGYDRGRINDELFALGNVGFLGKPFGIADLAMEIARLVSTAG